MASIDPETGELVVRIAYDGAARAGKTTNIIKLSEKLKQTVFTPEQPGERTVYFDWMKYKGGSFEGLPIRCEMVTVPGQELLKERRLILLEEADVIVEVFDVSAVTKAEIFSRITEIQEAPGFPCPRMVVVQLNKCDLPAMTPTKELAAVCKQFDPPINCLEAVASTGQSVQQTFIYAVRASLERVRALRKLGLLPSKKDSTGEGLLAWVKKNEAKRKGQASSNVANSPTPPPAQEPVSESIPDLSTELDEQDFSFLEDESSVPPALPPAKSSPEKVWPPDAGQSILDQIDFNGCELEAAGPDAWYGALGDWHLYSSSDCVFENELDGAQAMLAWAQHCSSLQALLSAPRCVVLAPVDAESTGGSGQWRLWQLVAANRSLRDEISMILDEQDQELIATHLCEMGRKLLEMESNRSYCPNLPACTIDSVGGDTAQVQYVGFLTSPPPPDLELHSEPMEDQALLRQEFSSIMEHDWPQAQALQNAFQNLANLEQDPRAKATATVLSTLVNTQAKPAVRATSILRPAG